jgi:hypothetical protein
MYKRSNQNITINDIQNFIEIYAVDVKEPPSFFLDKNKNSLRDFPVNIYIKNNELSKIIHCSLCIYLPKNFDRLFVVSQNEDIMDQYVVLYHIIYPPELCHWIPDEVYERSKKTNFWNSSEFFNLSIPELQILHELYYDENIRSVILDVMKVAAKMHETYSEWIYNHPEYKIR